MKLSEYMRWWAEQHRQAGTKTYARMAELYDQVADRFELEERILPQLSEADREATKAVFEASMAPINAEIKKIMGQKNYAKGSKYFAAAGFPDLSSTELADRLAEIGMADADPGNLRTFVDRPPRKK